MSRIASQFTFSSFRINTRLCHELRQPPSHSVTRSLALTTGAVGAHHASGKVSLCFAAGDSFLSVGGAGADSFFPVSVLLLDFVLFRSSMAFTASAIS